MEPHGLATHLTVANEETLRGRGEDLVCISRRIMLWTLHSLVFVIKSSYFGAGQIQIQLPALTQTLSKLLCSLNLLFLN